MKAGERQTGKNSSGSCDLRSRRRRARFLNQNSGRSGRLLDLASDSISQLARRRNPRRWRAGGPTLILPLRMAGPSSASLSTNRSILYSRPPRMLKPKPFTLFSSSTVKKSKSCAS